MRRLLPAALTLLALCAPAARASVTEQPWPPVKGAGDLYVHFGEEHINDADGPTLLPKVVQESGRYEPLLVTLSGDKANDGQPDQFALWREALKGFDDAGVPYLAAIGNHDRTSPPGVPGGTAGLFGGTLPDSLDVYKAAFADKPYPWGDAAPYPGIGPQQRASDDPAGAAGTYAVDVGTVRWIFLDNSCWALTSCDPFQSRADGGTGSQLDFLAAQASQATAAGRTVFVVMHMPTRDPRDQDYTDFTARNHVMGKGVTTTDNTRFEEIAAANGVDGVFLAHIKGQFVYRVRDVPYFIDGGAGGELYTEGPVGTDHGYWHGFRLVRVDGATITTDTVPIFVPDGIRIDGPDTLTTGTIEQFEGFGRQPVFNDPAKVEALELRDPAPVPKGGGGLEVAGIPLEDLSYGAPLLLLLLLVPLAAAPTARRRLAVAGGGLALLGTGGVGTLAVAQQAEPTSTPRESLPTPARMWTSTNTNVLRPVASPDDDPRRDVRTQTEDGSFTGVCPGRVAVRLTSGFEQAQRQVTVVSRPGPVLRSVQRRRAVQASRRPVQIARVRLAQPAVVSIAVKRGGRVVARRRAACVTAGSQVLRWSARGVRRGRYTLEVRVSSDRRPVLARYALRVR